jgi:hypothetical protein
VPTSSWPLPPDHRRPSTALGHTSLSAVRPPPYHPPSFAPRPPLKRPATIPRAPFFSSPHSLPHRSCEQDLLFPVPLVHDHPRSTARAVRIRAIVIAITTSLVSATSKASPSGGAHSSPPPWSLLAAGHHRSRRRSPEHHR